VRSDGRPPEDVARDEHYWSRVREAFHLHSEVVNLDHGWTNPIITEAFVSLVRHARELQALPAEMLPSMWESTSTTHLRAALATAMKVPPAEIALVRNATEALDTVLLGLPLGPGDEIVCSRHDYYAMLDALDQRRARDGVVLRMLEPPVPAPSMEALESLYAAAIGPRTRLVLLTHPSNLTGQLLPVRRIADRAHAAGAEVVVDGAQSLGLLDDPVRALGCDYYGASAHKWLGTPVGLGVLWMRPEHTAKVWPLVPGPVAEKGMARFEWIGTAPEYINAAAIPAVEWHMALGPARKAARLRHLAGEVRMRVRKPAPDVRFYTADSTDMSCGLTTFEIPGVDPAVLQTRLRQAHGILVQAMTGIRHAPAIRGVRVSPNIYSSPAELDRLGQAVATEVKKLRGEREP
jgi:selenocysteine lyase/cysteine desulfurase